MALDKQFLKYKLEKIKNNRIWKGHDSETKRDIRKENAKLSQEEADAIHSYLTGEDNIDKFDNKSYMENRLPGGLYLTNKGQLNIIQAQDDPKTKKSRLRRIMRRFRSIHKANLDFSKQLKILRKIFDSLNIILRRGGIKMDGKIQAGGYQSSDGQEGLTEDYIITDVIERNDGTLRYVKKRIIVKNGLIVGQRRM